MGFEVVRVYIILILWIVTFCSSYPTTGINGHIGVTGPKVLIKDVPFHITLSFPPLSSDSSRRITVDVLRQECNKDMYFSTIEDLKYKGDKMLGAVKLKIVIGDEKGKDFYSCEWESYAIPGWFSILPSLVAVVLAIFLRQSLLSLLAGIWLGCVFLNQMNPVLGFFKAFDPSILDGICTPEHVGVILFCLFIGGLIGVLGTGGGAQGLANLMSKVATSRRKASLATFFLGILMAFDDYASCLITGVTMSEVTGLVRISKEKLSFIVDSCAANAAAISFSSWVGVEISYIKREYTALGLDNGSIIWVFLSSLRFAFYPWLILCFCILSIVLGRDFGTMLKAERRAYKTGKLVREGGVPLSGKGGAEDGFLFPKPGIPTRWWNAAVPLLVVFGVAFGSMICDGVYTMHSYSKYLKDGHIMAARNHLAVRYFEEELINLMSQWKLSGFFSHSVPVDCLLWASFVGGLVAIILVLYQRILTLSEAMSAWMNGAKSMVFAILILGFAWTLGDVCKELQAAAWIFSSIGGSISVEILPTLVFLSASGVSFATGSAWGTMSILFPLMIRLAYSLDPGNEMCLLAVIAAILSGSVWGNQTSPIADSCIMSSISTGSDHTDHVKTQALYTLTVGLVSIITCYVPVCYGLYPWYIGYFFALTILTFILLFFGGHAEDPSEITTFDRTRLMMVGRISSVFSQKKNEEKILASPATQEGGII